MLHKKLTHPKSIAVIGASNNGNTPGGKVLTNLIAHNYKGELIPVNPKETSVQGLPCYQNTNDIPKVDLAIIAIASKFVLDTVKILTQKKSTRGFIIFSAGFGETDSNGSELERQIVQEINKVGGSLLGPNNIGLINQNYTGVFTTPIPKLNPKGVDFITGSGATAVFIIEAAMATGLSFSSVYSVGNSAQIGVEELLQHLDETFDPQSSSLVKLLYIESIENPEKLLKHATSLIQKGCKIAAIKAGSSKAGSRAASSHTGALANSDSAVEALFKKAGIIRCHGRTELVTVASILMHHELLGKNIGIITHAGGPAVMLTDTLSKNGLMVPEIKSKHKDTLLEKLYPGSSVSNPIDFLATGTASQLETIIDYCENKFSEIDAMVVIFGSPGLFPVYDVYDVLHKKIQTCKKPIFPIIPSIQNVKDELEQFIEKGNINFPDEVLFGSALTKVYHSKPIENTPYSNSKISESAIRNHIHRADNGYLNPTDVKKLLIAANIPVVQEKVCHSFKQCMNEAHAMKYPVVMKIIGPIHKSDVGGIVLNINNDHKLEQAYNSIMTIEAAEAVLLQPMKKGIELFIGAKKEEKFGHLILCGLGGIYIEVLKDISTRLSPISISEATDMIHSLKSYEIIKGIRNQEGVDVNKFGELISKVSKLVTIAPEITELDLNPLIGNSTELMAVDARIKIEK